MSVVISLSEARSRTPARLAVPARGVGRVAFGVDGDGRTRLQDLYQSDPVRILFPTPARGDIPSAAFVTTSGGLVGGDMLELTAAAGTGAAVQATAQATEKVYRSSGPDCRIDVALSAGAGAWLEWLPQETILFEQGRLARTTRAHLTSNARLLAGEILVLGRAAMGETVRSGLVRDSWEIRRNGRLVWADALCLDGAIDELVGHPAGLGGATAVATIVYAAEDSKAHLEAARELLGGDQKTVRAGATAVNGILLIRFLSADAYALRESFGRFWAGFRHEVAGYPDSLPRLWHI